MSVIQKLDASSAKDVEILRKHGYPVRDGRMVPRLSGLPMSGTGRQFATGFPILALMTVNETALVLDQGAVALGHLKIDGCDWAVFEPEAGEHTIGPEDFDEASHMSFQMVDPPDIEAASISIHPGNATLTDLIEGMLEIRVRAPLPLENLHVRLRLVMAGEPDIVTEGAVERLPAHIAGRIPLLQDLKTSLAKRGAVPSTAAQLQVSVIGLLSEQFKLLPSPQPFLYDERDRSWTAGEDRQTML
ncbi:hypothetical protein ACCT30_34205, partial [Rhizobium ruizarguesonis]